MIFSMISFVVTFASMWVVLVGFKNPFSDKVDETTVQDLARSDSLRAVELRMLQEIEAKKKVLEQLNFIADSLGKELSSREKTVKSLDAEIERLKNQLSGTEEERLQKLANIIAGLSQENLKRITENMDISLLVSIVLNLSPRKAQVVLNAMEPRKAAMVAREMTRIRTQSLKGS